MPRDRRRYVNAFLALWIAVLAIDGFRPINRAHQWLEDRIDYPLDLTGLWQGPWRLFGPEVDRVNLRLSARIEFADGAIAVWESPDWSRISPLQKFIHAREMNYFGNILKAGQEPAWDGLAAYLARTIKHPQGKLEPATTVTLLLRGALVPPLETAAMVPAEPYLAFDPPDPIYVWKRQP